MKIPLLSSILLLTLILLAPARAQAPTAASTAPAADTSAIKIKSGESLGFMGDSITQFGWDYPGGYVRQVITGLKSVGVDVHAIPKGISGQTSRQMVKRFQQDIVAPHPAWTTINCGVNDVWQGASGVPLDEYKKNVTTMVDEAQAAGIKVLLLTATPIQDNVHKNADFNKDLIPYNDFLRQLAKDKNVTLVDVSKAFWDKINSTPGDNGNDLIVTRDGVHPNAEGNFIFAREILKALGLTDDQIAAYEKQWRASDNATSVYGGIALSNGIPITAEQSAKIAQAGKASKLGYLNFEIVLCYRAFIMALQAHEQDPDYSPNLGSNQITPEVNKNILALIDALPASANPPPPTAKGTNFQASMFMGRAVGVSIAAENNVNATAAARGVRVVDLTSSIMFQAARDEAKAMGDKVSTLDFNSAINGFVPSTYTRFRELLLALPPAPPAPAPGAATTTTSNAGH